MEVVDRDLERVHADVHQHLVGRSLPGAVRSAIPVQVLSIEVDVLEPGVILEDLEDAVLRGVRATDHHDALVPGADAVELSPELFGHQRKNLFLGHQVSGLALAQLDEDAAIPGDHGVVRFRPHDARPEGQGQQDDEKQGIFPHYTLLQFCCHIHYDSGETSNRTKALTEKRENNGFSNNTSPKDKTP